MAWLQVACADACLDVIGNFQIEVTPRICVWIEAGNIHGAKVGRC